MKWMRARGERCSFRERAELVQTQRHADPSSCVSMKASSFPTGRRGVHAPISDHREIRSVKIRHLVRTPVEC